MNKPKDSFAEFTVEPGPSRGLMPFYLRFSDASIAVGTKLGALLSVLCVSAVCGSGRLFDRRDAENAEERREEINATF
jgi:hypothetical protein